MDQCPNCGGSDWTFTPLCSARACPHSTDPAERAKHDGETFHAKDGTARVAVTRPRVQTHEIKRQVAGVDAEGKETVTEVVDKVQTVGTEIDEAATMAGPALKPLEIKPHTHIRCSCGHEAVLPFGQLAAVRGAQDAHKQLQAAHAAMVQENSALRAKIDDMVSAAATEKAGAA